ncbi:MAG: radical SAM protein [Actinobacteria bacterium]|nr:radical SAM protein [Actinomycetota bacterium]
MLRISERLEKLFGRAFRTLNWPLPTRSLCPECLVPIDAELVPEDNNVIMVKRCAEHGEFHELIATDVAFFEKMERRQYGTGSGIDNPQVDARGECPANCGLCSQHVSCAAMAVVDLTNRCNLRCPVCFANSAVTGKVYEVNLEQVRQMLAMIRSVKPAPAPCLQYSGGEPTLHSDFIECLRLAKQAGFAQIQIATNGIRLAKSQEFCHQAGEAGLNLVYLQFDGLDDGIYRKTRGRALLDIKLKAIDNAHRAGIRTILVPTLVKGLNDHQIGDMTRFAIKNTDKIVGISWQPVSITGRIDYAQRLKMRFTISDLARCMDQQTNGLVQMHRDWYPLSVINPFSKLIEGLTGEAVMGSTCHCHCGAGTYLVVNSHTGEAVPFPMFIDIDPVMKFMLRQAGRLKRYPRLRTFNAIRTFQGLKKYYHEEQAPAGFDFKRFTKFLDGYVSFRNKFPDNTARLADVTKHEWRVMTMAAMHFQDVYNYETPRVQRCVVHYATPNGRMYPFCSYNCGPCYRQQVEEQFSTESAETLEPAK